MDLAIGLNAFTGWAAGACLASRGKDVHLLDRRALLLMEASFPAEVYHAASSLPMDETKVFLAAAGEAALSAARSSLQGMLSDLGEAQNPRVCLIVKRGPPPDPMPHARLSHAGLHAAEGEFYRYVAAKACADLGLDLLMVPAEVLLARLGDAAELSAARISVLLKQLGALAGPPWTQRQQLAAAAAWLALAER